MLESIRSLLRLSDDRDRSCAEVDQIANAQLTQVRSKLADLSVLQNVLQALIGQCRQAPSRTVALSKHWRRRRIDLGRLDRPTSGQRKPANDRCLDKLLA